MDHENEHGGSAADHNADGRTETRAEKKARLAAEARAAADHNADDSAEPETEVEAKPKAVHAIRLARRDDDPHARLSGRVNIGDFIVFATGQGWHLLPEGEDVELSREHSRLAIVLEPFGYDPEIGAKYHSVKNFPVAQYFQDARKSQLETNREKAAKALRAALKDSAVPAEEHTAIVLKAVARIPEPDPQY